MLNQTIGTDVSAFEGETSSKQVFQVDVDTPPMNNMMVVPEPQEEPDLDTKIHYRPRVSSGVHVYILLRDREHLRPSHQKDLTICVLLISSGESSTFRETIDSQKKKNISGWVQW